MTTPLDGTIQIQKDYLLGMLVNVLDTAINAELNPNDIEYARYKGKFDAIAEILTDHSGDIIVRDCFDTFTMSQVAAYANLCHDVYEYIDNCQDGIYSSSKEKLKEQFDEFDDFPEVDPSNVYYMDLD